MPSTPSTLLRLELQAPGENDGTWGTLLNNKALKLLEEAIAGYVEVPVLLAGATLTTTNYVSDQQRAMFINLTGTSVAGNIIVPPVSKFWVVKGSFTSGSVVFKTAGGTGVTIVPGEIAHIVCNGTNVYKVGISLSTVLNVSNNLSDLSNVDAARTNLGLGSFALLNTTPANSITTSMLVDNSVVSSKIVDNSISTAKLQDNCITSSKIFAGSVSLEKLVSYVPNSIIRWNSSAQPELIQYQPGFSGFEVFSTTGNHTFTTPNDGIPKFYKVTVTGAGEGPTILSSPNTNSTFSVSTQNGLVTAVAAGGGYTADSSITSTVKHIFARGEGGIRGTSYWGGGGPGSGDLGYRAGDTYIFYVKIPANTMCSMFVGLPRGGVSQPGIIVIERA